MKSANLGAQKKRLLGYAKFPAAKQKMFAHFLDYYLANPPLGNYADTDLKSYYAKAESLFNYILASKHGSLSLKVYNPPSKRHTYLDFVCDNMPFVVASLLNVFAQRGIYVYSQQNLIIGVKYQGSKIAELLPERGGAFDEEEQMGSHKVIAIRCIVEFLAADERKELQQQIALLLRQIKQVTKDWEAMRGNMFSATQNYEYHYGDKGCSKDDRSKVQLLTWLTRNKCLFLGYGKYSPAGKSGNAVLDKNSARGLCAPALKQDEISAAMATMKPQEGIDFLKLPVVSLIHRKVYIHCISIGIKRGAKIEEHRFLLLYSFDFFNVALEEIPFIRDHFKQQQRRLNIQPGTYRWRVFRYALACYPRDEMLQVLGEPIFERITDRIMEAFSSTAFRTIIYYDKRQFFINTAIMAPREDYGSEARRRFEKLLRAELKAGEGEFNVLFSEERLARVFLTYPLTAASPKELDLARLENEVTALGVGWRYRLRHSLLRDYGDEAGIELYKNYADSFSASYCESFSGEQGSADLQQIIAVGSGQVPVDINFLPEQQGKYYRLRLIGRTADSTLSNLVHILENAGAEPITSRPYFFKPCGDILSEVRLIEFNLAIRAGELLGDRKTSVAAGNPAAGFKDSLEETLIAVYRGLAENDIFNQLAISAAMGSAEIMLLRAWANYLAQLQNDYSRDYIRETLCHYPRAAKLLVKIFRDKFAGASAGANGGAVKSKAYEKEFNQLLEEVPSIEQDRILRYLLEVIQVTVRSNFYQQGGGELPEFVSFKLHPSKLSFCAKGQPQYEIFIYSPDFEGVHLRDGLLARGGIRWSDKRAGYRNEVYQLVAAQIIKNAIIVPTGAKGGFYIKNQEQSAEQVYAKFVAALLGITDNYAKGKVIAAKGIKRYDGDDPYLVVAPDKGTANFSDLANDIAAANNFWLGDAFASSGSAGYSHKDMGITARGAWESVRRSFAELGMDANQDPIEVIGVGDMSGDVFGNGMLLSENLKLICAFNHRNIFIDPNPDAKKSCRERRRLFNMPRSTWQDYDRSVISAGGGIFSRSEKKISISRAIQKKFGIKESSLSPDKLIGSILKSRADLLWFGGIGTYVKGSGETNFSVEDRPNDSLRINGSQLRVKVIGEGANLGATLEGRNEFDRAGGRVATDSNDNSGGVHCSDQEVNIKIMLSALQQEGKLAAAARVKLLRAMTEQVSDNVLAENRAQNLALSLERSQARELFSSHKRLADMMGAEELLGLVEMDDYITRPQLSILFGLVKNKIKAQLAEHSLLPREDLSELLLSYFPHQLRQFPLASVKKHFLAAEILNTQIANVMVDRLGLAFWDNLTEHDWNNLPDYVHMFVRLDGLFGFAATMDELAADPYSYPEAMKEIVKLRSAMIKLMNYGIYCGLGKDASLLTAAQSYLTEYGKGLAAEGEDKKIHMLNNGINLLMGTIISAGLPSGGAAKTVKRAGSAKAAALAKSAASAKSPVAAVDVKQLVKLIETFDRQLSLSKIIQVLDNHAAQEIWQRKGLNALTMGILEQKQRLLQGLLPEFRRLAKTLKDRTGDEGAKQCLSQWKEQNFQTLSSYNECISELDAAADLTKVAYLLSLLRKTNT